jgi:hypothetical protein
VKQPSSQRGLILLVIFVIVLAWGVKRVPREVWWLAPLSVFVGAEMLALIMRRPFTLGRVAGSAVLALMVGLAVRFLL